ncbi:MAG: hypothetical protein DI598_20730 [Pseudopedobacter saltans]|uniref:Pentapeptide repeat-containing protein n=1 Tax=Pseudopedobacter saltans TaxID=151895 RepID=A0A2W5FZ38_9SPHI|nr:MAG: hypothetical protein DI598_20730 [Pseudopedobacter saltans]
MLGVKIDKAEKFGFSISFDNCNLSSAIFSNRIMPKTIFRKCNLKNVDFSGADLSGSLLDDCDLEDAFFDGTNLQNVNFVTSYGYSFNPQNNKIRGAKFGVDGLPGLLGQYGIEVKF